MIIVAHYVCTGIHTFNKVIPGATCVFTLFLVIEVNDRCTESRHAQVRASRVRRPGSHEVNVKHEGLS